MQLNIARLPLFLANSDRNKYFDSLYLTGHRKKSSHNFLIRLVLNIF